MIGWYQAGCIYDYITLLVILFKNTPSLSRSARYSRNGILTDTMWKITGLNSLSGLTDLIDVILTILNIKLADPAIFLSS